MAIIYMTLLNFNIETIKTSFLNIKSQMIKSYPDYKILKDDGRDTSNTIYVKQEKRLHDLFDYLEKIDLGLNSIILMNTDEIKINSSDINKIKQKTKNYKKNKWNKIIPKTNVSNVLKTDKFNENIEEYLNLSFYFFSIILLCGFIYNKQIKN